MAFSVYFRPTYGNMFSEQLGQAGLISHDILQSFPSPPLDGSTNRFPNTCRAANSLFFFVSLRQMKGSVSAQSNSINRRVKPGPPHCSMNEKQFCQFNDYQRKLPQTLSLSLSLTVAAECQEHQPPALHIDTNGKPLAHNSLQSK